MGFCHFVNWVQEALTLSAVYKVKAISAAATIVLSNLELSDKQKMQNIFPTSV